MMPSRPGGGGKPVAGEAWQPPRGRAERERAPVHGLRLPGLANTACSRRRKCRPNNYPDNLSLQNYLRLFRLIINAIFAENFTLAGNLLCRG